MSVTDREMLKWALDEIHKLRVEKDYSEVEARLDEIEGEIETHFEATE